MSNHTTFPCDFKYRYESFFYDSSVEAYQHYECAKSAIVKTSPLACIVERSTVESLNDLWHSYELEGMRTVTIGKSLNGKHYVCLGNLSAKAR
jgi:hypothetical protein